MHENEEIQKVTNFRNDDLIEEINTNINSANADRIASYTSLIIWNISKALQKNPRLNLRVALLNTKEKLVNNIVDKRENTQPEQHYLTCAVLAWQNCMNQLNTEHLYEFIVQNMNNFEANDNNNSNSSLIESSCLLFTPGINIHNEPTIVMALDERKKCTNVKCAKKETVKKRSPSPSPPASRVPSLMKQKPCCKAPGCTERLDVLAASTAVLRKRATELAKREAKRMEILERAESSWKDLETRYRRRMALGQQTERSLIKDIENMTKELNESKETCEPLIKELKEKSKQIEEDRAKLIEIERNLQEKAILRRNYTADIAKGDSRLADEQMKASQIDRDIQYNEDKRRRKMAVLQTELEATEFLEFEAQRAITEELSTLKKEIRIISDKLTRVDDKIAALQNILQRMSDERQQILNELGDFNQKCDPCIKKALDELNKKRDELQELKQEVIDCACKLPIDREVEVKRTPSSALLCLCLPEDLLEEPCDECSCVSIHTNLLTSLLSDLFSGLKTELGTTVHMPCEILKCLEDSYNWNKSSPIKTKLFNFFSNLLLKELDIAIATAIEHYHAKWIGATCADTARMLADAQEEVAKAQARICDREVEERAQQIAQKLADQLFREKADKLAAQRAKEILASGPPPCECLEKKEQVFPCLLQPKPLQQRKKTFPRNKDYTSYWFKTHENVNHIMTEITNLKKDTIKKQDLRTMEKKLTNIVQRATNTDYYDLKAAKEETNLENNYLVQSRSKYIKFDGKNENHTKIPKSNQISKIVKFDKKPTIKRQMIDRNFAVNICMCDPHKSKKINRRCKPNIHPSKSDFDFLEKETSAPKKTIQDIMSPNVSDGADKLSSLLSSEISCEETCVCLNKVPSKTSIKELLNTLIKWQNDIESPNNKSLNYSINSPKATTKEVNEAEIKRQYQSSNQKDTLIQSVSKYSTIKINDDIVMNQYSSEKKINGILSDYHSLSSNEYADLDTKDHCSNEDTISHKQSRKCDYSVKFLGMTLIDKKEEPNKVDKKSIKTYPDDFKQNFLLANKNHPKNQDNFLKHKVNEEKSEENKNTSVFQNNVAEIKSNNESDNCTCCVSDTKELEENTFQLLQEHLNMKLKGYIKTQCKSNCIPVEDEQKILCNIFNKIKELINEYQDTRRNEINDEIIENSWNRALGLLKEYINVKIKKTQKYSEPQSNTIQDELQKKTLTTICDLINNDFNRIKALCICNNNKQVVLAKTSTNHLSKSCSPFYICNNKTDEVQTVKSVHFLESTKTQTFSPIEPQYKCIPSSTISHYALLYNKQNPTNKPSVIPKTRSDPIPKDFKVTIDKLDIFNDNNNVVDQIPGSEDGSTEQFFTISDCVVESQRSYILNESSLNNLPKMNEEDNESIKLVLKRSPKLLGKKSVVTITDNLNDNLSLDISISDEDNKSNLCSIANEVFSEEKMNESFNIIMNASKNAVLHSDEPETMVEHVDCECKALPLCYVKMLVDGLENLLLKKKCTCYFSKKMCPIHSKTT